MSTETNVPNYRIYDRTGGGVTHDIYAETLEAAIEAGREWIEGGDWSGEEGVIRKGVTLGACVREITTRAPRPDLDGTESSWVSDLLALETAPETIRGYDYDDLDRTQLESLADYLEHDDGSLDEDDMDLCRSIATQIREALEDDDEDITDEQDEHDCSGSYSDDEPDCESEGPGEDDGGHDWRSPFELVGGCDSNPGVQGHGGTCISITTVCACCGKYRTETHAGSQRNPGEAESEVEYRDADEASNAWLVRIHEEDGWIPTWLAEQLDRPPTTRYTEDDAKAYVAEHADDEDEVIKLPGNSGYREIKAHDDDDLEHVYAAIYGVRADDKDREEGLWSLICAAV
jgi:hypothetical protein